MGTCNGNVTFHVTKARNFNENQHWGFQPRRAGHFNQEKQSNVLAGEPPHSKNTPDLWVSGPRVRQFHHSNVRPQCQRHLDRRWNHLVPFPFTENAKFDYPWLLGCHGINGQSWLFHGSKPNLARLPSLSPFTPVWFFICTFQWRWRQKKTEKPWVSRGVSIKKTRFRLRRIRLSPGAWPLYSPWVQTRDYLCQELLGNIHPKGPKINRLISWDSEFFFAGRHSSAESLKTSYMKSEQHQFYWHGQLDPIILARLVDLGGVIEGGWSLWWWIKSPFQRCDCLSP